MTRPAPIARPILFSAPMVRALLDGRKSQTRRVLKPQTNVLNGGLPLNNGRGAYSTENGWKRYPFAPGDRLWVRETHYVWSAGYKDGSGQRISYRADDPDAPVGSWTPSIYMHRFASRLTLTVTDVRVQRVQDISEDDARAESVRGDACGPWGCEGLIEDFADLWDSLNAKRGFGWDANPWVVALTFTVERRNIDAGGEHE